MSTSVRWIWCAATRSPSASTTSTPACPQDVPADVRIHDDLVEPADPRRQERAARHAAEWLPRLEPGSDAWLVVQRNLGSDSLHRWLQAELPHDYAVLRAATQQGVSRAARAASLRHRDDRGDRAAVAGLDTTALYSTTEYVPLYTSSAGPLRCTCPPATPHADHTAGHLDPPGVGSSLARPLPRGERRRRRTGAAGEGLAAPPLMHAHPDAANAVGDERVGRHDELDVGAVRAARESPRAPRTGREPSSSSTSASATTTCGFPTPTASPGRATSSRRAETIASPGATTNGPRSTSYPPATLVSVAHPSAGADRHRLALGDREQPVLDQVVGEHPDAVAAHLRRAPVGVVVVHEPLGGRILGERGRAILQVLRAHRADDPVAPDAEMPVGRAR